MREKLIGLSYYLGFLPFCWQYNKLHHVEPCRREHYLQVVILNLYLLFSVVIFVICFGLHSLIFIYLPNLALNMPLAFSFYIFGALLTVYLIIALEGVIAVIIGCNPRLPLYKVVASGRVIGFSIFMMSLQLLFVVTGIYVMIHSSSIVSAETEGAEIYMLYDDMGYIPRRVFTTGFYLESLVSVNRWGQGSVAIVPLSEDTMEDAFADGRLVFIASHGADGYIYLPSGMLYGPQDIKSLYRGDHLQYVYLSGCETGILDSEWKQVFAPAEVKTFDRLSTTIEHIYWLMNKGPKVINSLE